MSNEGGDHGGMESSGMYQGGAVGLHQGGEAQGGQESGVLMPPGTAGYNGEAGDGPPRNGVYQANPYAFISTNSAGQMMSPTQSIHFIQPGHILTSQDGQVIHSGQVLQFSMPSQGHRPPTTPTLGPLSLQPSMLPGQPHNHHFSHNPGLTQSPVQILGHTLGTSLFSPPPSSGAPHGIFINSPTNSGKVMGMGAPGSPARAAVGSGVRLRRYDSPKQNHVPHPSGEAPSSAPVPSSSMSPVESPSLQQKQLSKLSTNGSSPVPPGIPAGFQSPQLPPRLAQQQQQQRNTGTRYQNQRHPTNRVVVAAKPVALETSPTQFLTGVVGSKKEPLLPTPPSSLKMKLDTNLTSELKGCVFYLTLVATSYETSVHVCTCTCRYCSVCSIKPICSCSCAQVGCP